MMKASELIKVLQEAIFVHGDLPIEAYNAAGDLVESFVISFTSRDSEPKQLFVIENE